MEPEAWRRLEELFHSTIDLGENERRLFLDHSCRGDEALRRKLELMLSRGKEAEQFLESPAVDSTQVLARWGTTENRAEADKFVLTSSASVSHYRIVEPIGSGGTGVVYKAEDTTLGRFVALKFLSKNADDFNSVDPVVPGDVPSDKRWIADLRREARLCSALDHPNICTVYEIGEHEGCPFIAMQFLTGRTLKEEIREETLSTERILDIGIQIADGLDAAHAAGIIHRDIKPTNVFVTQRGEVKLLDFGLAKRRSRQPPDATQPARTHGSFDTPLCGDTMTLPGFALGTVAYMSPEQIRGDVLDGRTDVFSLGLVLYEMAAGRAAFEGQSSGEVLDAILYRELPPASQRNSAVPKEFESVIAAALAKDRAARLQTAAELRDRLKQLKEGSRPPARPRQSVRGPLMAASGAVMVVVALASYMLSRPQQAAPVRQPQTIVLSDFANSTGERLLGEALKEGLRAQLEQSPFLTVLSDQKTTAALRFMGRAANTPVSGDVAREICLRTGSGAVVSGSILRLQSNYVLGVDAVDCKNGSLADSEQVQAHDHELILPALGKAATALRLKLGESQASIEKFDAPPEQVTTSSLEALQAYTLANRIMTADGVGDSIPFFKQATELDPEFAMAHAKLAAAYLSEGETEQARAAMTKAYALRERVSARERLYIEAHYFHTVTGEYDKAVQAYELWQQTYPGDVIPSINLSTLYAVLGRHDRALKQALQVLHLDPKAPNGYFVVASAYLNLGEFDKARTVLKQAEERKLVNPMFWGMRCMLAFLRGDEGDLARQFAAAMALPGNLYSVLAFRADVAAYDGHMAEARTLTQRAIEGARKDADSEGAFDYGIAGALREAEFGYPEIARNRIATLAIGQDRWSLALAALGFARTGEVSRASSLSRDLERRYPEDTLVKDYWLPTIEAAIDVDQGNPAKAVEALEPALPYELGLPQTQTNILPYPVYLRGLAFLEAHRGGDAAIEFQKVLDHPGIVANCPLGALAQLGLARAYAIEAANPAPMLANVQVAYGRDRAGASPQAAARTKARAAYQAFLAKWKEADADIPILKQAKAEYGALQ